jgi:hypothetical protein
MGQPLENRKHELRLVTYAARGGSVKSRVNAFLVRWVGWVTLGESLGFLGPVVGQLIAAAFLRDGVLLLVLGGVVEGAVLGWFQAHVLRGRLPAVSVRRWVGLTALAAAIAWTLGLFPAATDAWQEWPAAAQIGGASVAGVLLLGSIGFAQWIELRRHVAGAWRWMAGSAAAWAAGLAVFFAVSTPLWQPGQEQWLVAAIGVGAAVLMAFTMAVISGVVLVRILPDRP